MDKIINLGLMKHPLNWVIVTLMVLLFSIGAHVICTQFSSDDQ
jgi:hypothetical protein